MKKVWMVLSVISALVSGMLIYEGAVLFLRYTDRRMGLLVAASGAAAAVLFIFCIFESFCKSIWDKSAADDDGIRNSDKDGESIIKGIRMEFLLTCISFGIAGTGILLYRLRFHPIFQIYLYTLLLVGVVLIIAAAGWFLITSGRMREREFRNRILSGKDKWKEMGWVSRNKTTEDLFRTMADGKLANLQAWGAGAILLVELYLLELIRDVKLRVLLAGLGLYVILNLIIQCVSFYKGLKSTLEVLSRGDTKNVLGLFTVYYERMSGRAFSLPSQMQGYAVAALCDQEAYSDALALLDSIRRKPKLEVYFQQYVWLCSQGLGDRQGCIRALRIMKESLRYLKGKNLEAMQQQIRLFENYMEGNCSELIRAAQDESKNEFQRRTRRRLAEAAAKQKGKTDDKIACD